MSSLFAALLTVAPSIAAAQTPPAERVRIAIGYGTQLTSRTFDGVMTQTRYFETETITSTYDVKSGPVFDAGATVRLAGPLAVGVAVSSFSRTGGAEIAGSIPHPFFFNMNRGIVGSAGGARHKELGTHVSAVFLVPTGSRLDIAIEAGPSIFSVQQGLVGAVTYSDAYPYDAPAFESATITVSKQTVTGFHVGADVGYRFSAHVGVGAVAQVLEGVGRPRPAWRRNGHRRRRRPSGRRGRPLRLLTRARPLRASASGIPFTTRRVDHAIG